MISFALMKEQMMNAIDFHQQYHFATLPIEMKMVSLDNEYAAHFDQKFLSFQIPVTHSPPSQQLSQRHLSFSVENILAPGRFGHPQFSSHHSFDDGNNEPIFPN